MILAQTIDTDSTDAMILALKRWVGQGTLTTPRTTSATDLLARYWLFVLVAIVLIVLLIQGPGRFFAGLLRKSEFETTLKMGLRRLRARLLVPMAMFGLVLCSWSTSQLLQYGMTANLDSLMLTLRGKTVSSFALEQGILAALTPLRDLINLADIWPMVAAGLFFAFRYSSQAQWIPNSIKTRSQVRAQLLVQFFWIVASVWLVYRLVLGVSGDGGLPLHSGAWFEIVVEPITMILIDATLLAWVIVELRDSLEKGSDQLAPDAEAVFGLFPAILLIAILLAPARVFAHVVWLTWNSVLETMGDSAELPARAVEWVVWALSWGLIDLQIVVAPLAILAGAVAFGGGSIRSTLGIAWRTLRQRGSQYFLITLAFMAFAFLSSSAMTVLMLYHPAEPWVLMAADFYAHLASLGLGLWYLSCLIELAAPFAKIETVETAEQAVPEAPLEDPIDELRIDQSEPAAESNAVS